LATTCDKKSDKKTQIIVVLVVLLSLSVGVCFGISHEESKSVSVYFTGIVEKEVPSLSVEYVLVKDNPPFLQIAEQVANATKYDANTYNCQDFSRDLVKELRAFGYDAEVVTGWVNCSAGWFDKDICNRFGGRHSWVILKIPIEATVGQTIEPIDFYKKIYKED